MAYHNPYITGYPGPPKPTCLEVFMVNHLVFRWPKPLFFMVLGAHGMYIQQITRVNWSQFQYPKVASTMTKLEPN